MQLLSLPIKISRSIKPLVVLSMVSIFLTNATHAATCPAGDKAYFIGENSHAPADAKIIPLSWIEGNRNKTFNFPDSDITLNISFPFLISKSTALDSINPPGYVANSFGLAGGVSDHALFLVHNSNIIEENHTMAVSINKPVSRFGYVTQDLDSLIESDVVYQEKVDVSQSDGTLKPINYTIITDPNHAYTPEGSTAISVAGKNCPKNGCPIETLWQNKPANYKFSLTHSNVSVSRFAPKPHAVAYKDFYFCISPPKGPAPTITLIKNLPSGTAKKSDRFTFNLSDEVDTKFSNGNGSTSAGATGESTIFTQSLEGLNYSNQTYTLSEAAFNKTNTELNDYITSYECTDSANKSFSQSSFDNKNSRGIKLSNLKAGQNITCTFTNNLPPTIRIQKSLPNGLYESNDRFNLKVINSNSNEELANA